MLKIVSPDILKAEIHKADIHLFVFLKASEKYIHLNLLRINARARARI